MLYILLLLLNSFYASIITIIKSIYLKNTELKHILFIQYLSGLITLVIIYNLLKKEDLIEIFDNKNKNIWIFCIITSLLGYLSWYYYYECLNNLGPSRTQIIYSVSKMIFVVILSIYILKNRILDNKTCLGILLGLISMYLLKETNNYV